MVKKILISDYDQTFYIDDQDIEKNKIAVNKFINDGNIFVIATGRSYYDFKIKKDKYNIIVNYTILNHGATIIDNKNNILINFTINNDIIDNLKNDLNLSVAISYFCCSCIESRVDFNDKNLTKINVKYKTKDYAMKVNKLINDKYSEFVNSYYVNKNSIEIISKETNKSKAIKILLDKININPNNCYVIGDGYSDIEMIKDYNGYAMKNSVSELNLFTKYDGVSYLVDDIMKNDI